MIDYEALSRNCIMLRFHILQNVITLNPAAYEAILFDKDFRQGWSPEQNERLFTWSSIFWSSKCLIHRSVWVIPFCLNCWVCLPLALWSAIQTERNDCWHETDWGLCHCLSCMDGAWTSIQNFLAPYADLMPIWHSWTCVASTEGGKVGGSRCQEGMSTGEEGKHVISPSENTVEQLQLLSNGALFSRFLSLCQLILIKILSLPSQQSATYLSCWEKWDLITSGEPKLTVLTFEQNWLIAKMRKT